MNTRIISITALFFGLILSISVLADGLPVVPDGIIAALKSGNATELAKFFNTSIEVAILEEEDVYSKNQAEQIIKSFFSKNTPSDFKVLHEGGKDGAKYVIGNLTTSKGTFRVYFLLKETAGKSFIHTLRIENEDE